MNKDEYRQNNRERIDAIREARLERERATARRSYAKRKAKLAEKRNTPEARAEHNARQRARRKDLRARKLCCEIGCYGYVFDGKARCAKHLRHQAAKRKRLDDARQATGVCKRCPQQAESNRPLCTACRLKKNAESKIRSDKRKAAGICTRCPNQSYGFRACLICRRRERALKRYAQSMHTE